MHIACTRAPPQVSSLCPGVLATSYVIHGARVLIALGSWHSDDLSYASARAMRLLMRIASKRAPARSTLLRPIPHAHFLRCDVRIDRVAMGFDAAMPLELHTPDLDVLGQPPRAPEAVETHGADASITVVNIHVRAERGGLYVLRPRPRVRLNTFAEPVEEATTKRHGAQARSVR